MFPEKYNLGKRLGGGRKEGAPKLPLPLGPEQEDTRRRLTLEGLPHFSCAPLPV
jgi:hypothetical protein